MSREMRAAQFAPFAALSGYRELIREQSRLTEPERELSPEVQEGLKRKLDLLEAGTAKHPRIRVTWFCPDRSPEGRKGTLQDCRRPPLPQKSGGTTRVSSGILKRIDPYQRILFLQDGNRIPLDYITDIESSWFSETNTRAAADRAAISRHPPSG